MPHIGLIFIVPAGIAVAAIWQRWKCRSEKRQQHTAAPLTARQGTVPPSCRPVLSPCSALTGQRFDPHPSVTSCFRSEGSYQFRFGWTGDGLWIEVELEAQEVSAPACRRPATLLRWENVRRRGLPMLGRPPELSRRFRGMAAVGRLKWGLVAVV